MPPRNFSWDQDGRANLAGAPVSGLASAFGTPLYLYDEADLAERIATYVQAFGAENVAIAGKAFLTGRLLQLAQEAGLGLDVVREGELEFALRLGFPAERIIMHGLYKPMSALRTAARQGIAFVVVESPGEVAEVAGVARQEKVKVPVLLRLAPAVDVHTHPSLATGAPASQFGVPIADGQALETVRQLIAAEDAIEFKGYHMHVGSQISTLDPFVSGAAAVADFVRTVFSETGHWPEVLDLGGGLGITSESPAPSALREAYEVTLAGSLSSGPPMPRLMTEPGRFIVSPPGVTIYHIVQRKTAADGRTYLIVDGGMSDGPRPALYGAKPDVAVSPRRDGEEVVDVAGMHCESGDIVRRDVTVTRAEVGDLLVVFDTGAYNHSMASHYNRVPVPPVVFVKDGVARPATRRDNLSDWLRLEVR